MRKFIARQLRRLAYRFDSKPVIEPKIVIDPVRDAFGQVPTTASLKDGSYLDLITTLELAEEIRRRNDFTLIIWGLDQFADINIKDQRCRVHAVYKTTALEMAVMAKFVNDSIVPLTEQRPGGETSGEIA